MGNVYKRQGRYSEAEPLCVKALELDKRLLGKKLGLTVEQVASALDLTVEQVQQAAQNQSS